MMWFAVTNLLYAALVGSSSPAMVQHNYVAIADTDSVLTMGKINRMKTFWASYAKEPDSVHAAAKELRRDAPVAVSIVPTVVELVDMTAMAAKFPSVARDLKQAGLTVKQWRIYREVLLSIYLTNEIRRTSLYSQFMPMGRELENCRFLQAHPKVIGEMRKTGIWFPEVHEAAFAKQEP